MLETQFIKINDQIAYIRRLANQAKRIVISNVCPSIPNLAIEDALKQIDIIPTSQINYLKAGIKMEGYEHIMSFRRQMYIKHENYPKLPSSTLITINDNQLRIFFADNNLTCFSCKANGHTSNNCNKSTETKDPIVPIFTPNTINTISNTIATQPTLTENDTYQSTSSLLFDNNQEQTTLDQSSENASDAPSIYITSNNNEESSSTLIKPPDFPNYPLFQNTTMKKEKTIKKAKIRSRSNLFHKADNATPEEYSKPIEKFFTSNNNPPISYFQFIHILDNFTNKSINIHSFTEEVNIGITPLMDIIDQIRLLVSDRSLKSCLTKLENLLFQAQPVPSS